MFFPVQAIGFLLAGLAMLRLAPGKPREKALYAAALPVFKGTFLFVGMMVLGIGVLNARLSALAVRMKKPTALVLFVVSFVFILAMGYLSSRDFTEGSLNWAAELVNIIAEGSLLWGVLLLHRAGLPERL